MEDAYSACVDAGRCAEPDAGPGADALLDAGVAEDLDAGCASPRFDGAGWVCPVRFDSPSHGNVTLEETASAAEAWCVEHGFLAASEFATSGRRQCYGCYYQSGSVGYGFVVTWGGAYKSCDSCGNITSVSCY